MSIKTFNKKVDDNKNSETFFFSTYRPHRLIDTQVTMLGRKQSLKGETVLADYGPEEALNENADIEWVNKVFNFSQYKKIMTY